MAEVVLVAGSDLSLLRGADDATRFNNVEASLFDDGSFKTTSGAFVLESKFRRVSVGGKFLAGEHNGGNGLNLYTSGDWDAGAGSVSIFGSSNTSSILSMSSDNFINVKFDFDGVSTLITSLNGVVQSTDTSAVMPSDIFAGTYKAIGGRVVEGVSGFAFQGEVLMFKYTDPNNSANNIDLDFTFGATTLPDANGDNVTLAVGSYVWTKIKNGEPVEVYDNATIYEAQLPEIPVEFQNVTDIQTDAPPTNDVFWGAYDSDWLVVNVQPVGFVTGAKKYNYTYGY